jgi:hypothetical protein
MTEEYIDFIGIYKNVISQDECLEFVEIIEKYLQSCDQNNVLHGVEQFGNVELGRHDYSINGLVNLPYESLIIHKKLTECMYRYAHKYFPIKQLTASSKEVKIQKTPPRGGYHQWHCEQCCVNTSSRVLAWMVYLNDIPDGEGETEFIWQKLRIKPEAGKFLIWPAYFTHTHRGNPVYSCDKYIATGWYTFDN